MGMSSPVARLAEKFVLEPHSSTWKYPTVSPSRFWPLVEIHQEIRAHGFCADLAQQSDYLAPMVAGMVDYVDCSQSEHE